MPDQTNTIDVHARAEAVRQNIHMDPSQGAAQLVSFARRFAIDTKLQDMALVTSLEVSEEDHQSAPSEEVDQLLALVDRIVEDHLHNGGLDAVQKRERRYARIRDHYLSKRPAQDIVFQCENVTKTYRESDFELRELTIDLRLSQITGVVGQNAHGKTTLLRIVAGELQHDRGTCSYPYLGALNGPIDWIKVKSSIAYVPQNLQPWRGSLRDTLHYEAALRGVKGRANEREVRFVVERLDLGGHLDKGWDQLSGGYQLRFALARALVWKPRLLVLDEPLANLDIKAKSLLLQDVRDLAQSFRHPMAVLMSSHELHGLEAVCQQMVFLNQGKVIYVGSSEAVGDDLQRNEYELGTSLNLADLRQLMEGTGVEEIREEGVSFVIRTRQEMDHPTLLRTLLDRGIDIQYFRDNTRSVRRLFQ